MKLFYRRTQIGYILDTGLILTSLVLGVTMALSGFNWAPFVLLLVLAACVPLFGALTVVVAEQTLTIRFGVGIIRKSFSLDEVKAFREVENPWTYGWGVRLTPHGWLYNISGLRAVEIEMISGKKYRIGTNEPEALIDALRQAVGPRKATG
ncbi:MAG: hypothetical protein AABZ02_09950 [Bacteroidota bacterium]